MSGEVVSVERKESRKLGFMDVMRFQIDVHDAETGDHVASTTSSWLVIRGGSVVVTEIVVGTQIPEFRRRRTSTRGG